MTKDYILWHQVIGAAKEIKKLIEEFSLTHKPLVWDSDLQCYTVEEKEVDDGTV